MLSKKGQLGNLQGIIISLIVVGILLGAAFMIFAQFQQQDTDNQYSVDNETGAYINSTGYTVNESDTDGFNSFSVTEARNVSDGTVISDSEYTVDSSDGIVFNATAKTYPDVNLDYEYEAGGETYGALEGVIGSIDIIPQLLALVVLIAVIGIILAVVFNVIPGASRGA